MKNSLSYFQWFLASLSMFISVSASAQWSPLTSGTSNVINGMYFVDDNTGYIAETGGGIRKTTDGGATWVPQSSGTGSTLANIRFTDALTGIAVGDNSTILRTTDGGANWNPVTCPVSTFLRGLWFVDANLGFISGGNPGTNVTILKTVDGGQSWTDISPTNGFTNTNVSHSICFTDANNGYACNWDGRILRTTDGGATWTTTTGKVSNNHLMSIFFTDAQNGYCAGGDAALNTTVILKTTDAGATWTATDNPYPAVNFLSGISFNSPTTGFAVGGYVQTNNAVILKTADSGATWTPVYSNTNTGTRLTCIALPSQNIGYVGGLNGIILKDQNLCTDTDNDGYCAGTLPGEDCDDANPAVHPGATEVCNGIDDDCDGLIDTADPSLSDTQNPTPFCVNVLVVQIPPAPVTMSGSNLDAGSYDNCGSVSFSISQDGVNFTPTTDFYCPGTFPVYMGVTDLAGNFDYCQSLIVVQDNSGGGNVPPNVTCADNVEIMLDANCQATINVFDLLEGGPYAADCYYLLEIFQGPGFTNSIVSGLGTVIIPSGYAGQTLIYQITNTDSGVQCDGTIELEDKTQPVITCPADKIIAADENCQGLLDSYPPVSLSDNCTPQNSISVTQNVVPPNFSAINDVLTATLTADDGHGNMASCSFTLTLVDNSPPNIACPSNQNRSGCSSYTAIGTEFDFFLISENCPANGFSFDWTLLGATTGNGVGSTMAGTAFLSGNTSVQWTITDGAGNPSICSFIVTVIPGNEICNGIDDDCDGQIDEDNVCCPPGCCPANMVPSGIELVNDGNFGPNSTGQWVNDYHSIPPYNWCVNGTADVVTGASFTTLPCYDPYWHSCVGKSGDPINDYFLVVNDGGWANSPLPPPIAWRQTITVIPGKQYLFSAWVNNIINIAWGYDPIIQLQIIDPATTPPTVLASTSSVLNYLSDWEKICLNWQAPNPANATSSYILEIRNLNSSPYGNDWALDCISFQECVPACAGGDADGDGYCSGTGPGYDCDDNNPAVHPCATEICNSIDDDCDGLIDLADPDLTPHPDYAALMALYNATNGPAWTNNTGWGTCDVCNWHGVTCDGNGRVSSLSLTANNLTGTIPPEIGNLSHLTLLYLYINQIGGSIPPEIGNLSNLVTLSLAGNQLIGSIPPELGNLTNLQNLGLEGNQLTGPIPLQLFNLSNLQLLYLYSNQLTGAIPLQIGNLVNLHTLSLAGNQLTGPIPPILGSLINLKNLGLEVNQLSGCFPATLANLCSQLTFYNFTGNPGLPGGGDFAAFCANGTGGDSDGDGYCSGTGPGYDCDDNNPAIHPGAPEICNGIDDDCDGLVDLADPDLTPHPDYAALMALYNATNGPAWTNKTGWGTDCNVCNWQGVTCDGNGRVIYLDRASNNLSGTLPPDIGNLTYLEELNLGGNNLSGSIPSQITNLTFLKRLYLGHNNFSGNIPAFIGSLTLLETLYLNDNNFTGNIPVQLWALTNLQYLYMSDNQLTGALPSAIGNLINLYHLNLQNNQLSGNIPTDIGLMNSLDDLRLHNNQFSGSLPPQIGTLPNLQAVVIQDNLFTGCFPATFTSLCPKYWDFSNNPGLPGGGDFAAFCANGTGGDTDGDGYCSGTGPGYDCDDNNPAVHPGATEICNGIDDNCNGQIDEGNVCCPPGPIVYVKASATGLNNGTSWADAYTDLQTALTSTCPGITQIWVAAGAYKPTSGTDRTISFVMKNNLAIYGGFNGTETLLSQRNWVSNVTVLSGDIGTAGDNSDNSYHVIFNNNNGLNSSAVLDGFTIKGGNANGGNAQHNSGGGINNFLSSPSIANCIFSENTSNQFGGGILNNGSSPVVLNCIFSKNSAYQGGGIYNESSTSILIDCSFYENSAIMGGGMFNRLSVPNLTNCIFLGNSAKFAGGMYNWIYSSSTLTNCTFSGNLASDSGGGLLNDYNSSPTLKNCIVWGNSSGVGNVVGSSCTYLNTIVQGLNLGGGVFNGNTDPLFVNQPNFNNAPTTAGDLHLQGCSPAIDVGTNTGAPAIDLDGNPRPHDGDGNGTATTDLGAYEYQGTMLTWYKDQDNDGYSDGTTKVQCNQPGGYKLAANLIATSGDCQDGNGNVPGTPNATYASIHPNATEVCNGIDDNCNGTTDEGLSGLTYNGNVNLKSQVDVNAWPSCYAVINGKLDISDAGITNLAPLANLTQVTGSVTLQKNNALTSLNGLQGLTLVGGKLTITKNNILTDCCPIELLLINGGVSGSITINNNLTPCNTVTQILNACPNFNGGGGNNLVVAPCPGCPIGGQVASGFEVALFPNPTTGEINLSLTGELPKSGSIQVHDLLGRVLQRETLVSGEKEHTLSLTTLPAGVYFVKVLDEGLPIWSEKVVKQ